MNNITRIFRSLFKKGEYNVIKILSLSLGLTVGLVLLAKVYFETSYDRFYPDAERIYRISSLYEVAGGDPMDSYPQVSGGTAVNIKTETPEVELATRFTYIEWEGAFETSTRLRLKGTVIMADSCFFDLFGHPVTECRASGVLSQPMYALVSRSLADRIGEKAVGETIELQSYPGRIITIGGIFDDLPDNSTLNYDVVVSMASISKFMWDGSMNTVGNDRYTGFIKLYPGADETLVDQGIRRMEEKYLPTEELSKAGVKINYSVTPLVDFHKYSASVKRMNLILGLLAFALILTAVLNYILVVVSGLLNRTREIAVHKCYGAGFGSICKMAITESFVHLVLALVVSLVLILGFRGVIARLIGVSVESLFLSWDTFWLLLICAVVFLITGLSMAYLHLKVPVACAMNNYRKNRRIWKLSLLAIQFVAIGFIGAFLLVITRQYAHMTSEDTGYNTENLVYTSLRGVDGEMRNRAFDELSRMPIVQETSYFSELPFRGTSGNNISLPGDDRELFNIADLDEVSDNFFEMMRIPLIEGNSFDPSPGSSRQIMVDRSFVERMKDLAGWEGSPVGREVMVTGHSSDLNNSMFTICGVYENIRVGSFAKPDSRPTVAFYRPLPGEFLAARLYDCNPESIKQIEQKLSSLFPGRELHVYYWANELQGIYIESRNFRDAVSIGSIVILLITLIGLMGYTNDELNRRRKEIAIRKINGGRLQDILRLFMKDILWIALPFISLGIAVSAYVADRWQQDFAVKQALSWDIVLATLLGTLLVILSLLNWKVYREANANPVSTLKLE